MSTTPISDSNRGHAVTIKGVNFTEYLTVHERGPFVLYQVARDLELKLAEAVRLGDAMNAFVQRVGTYDAEDDSYSDAQKTSGEWEAFKASSVPRGTNA